MATHLNPQRPLLYAPAGVVVSPTSVQRPLISVVTPFYNTAPYLAECIESVLAQDYPRFEYLLVNNKSTDGSREIAAKYAALDDRIRLIDNEEFLDQMGNYNSALSQISPDSEYVKMVQADDAAFPNCVSEMVALAEAEPTVKIVSSYYLRGDRLFGDGVPRNAITVPGRDICRQMVTGTWPLSRTDTSRGWITGSQTTVLYRARDVRSRKPFFPTAPYFSDSFAAIELLLDGDLGFVHQVLTFIRDDNPSIMTGVDAYHPLLLQSMMILHRYGSELFPDDDEREALAAELRAAQYSFLARRALIGRAPKAFWQFQRIGLAASGQDLDRVRLARQVLVEVGRSVLNPLETAERVNAWRRAQRR
jgi:glycosyltransferase involved in cell wall biosynthesis